ncbi:glutamate synthase subunit beta [Castellaniella sp.]|uniref:glutamate synthase subunit beta n=1 Tax=Castellaniella sp. TaxID=1955812 RepID=UPI002AFF2A55|nr:glutamate synthase subunit beta [Castellaniella sp.]
MGKITGFMEFDRIKPAYEAPETRLRHWKEFVSPLTSEEARVQGARCMDCGVPFCTHACPVNNIIPDWNDLVYRQDWKRALDTLLSTNNFPEFTGRICPAPCEAACTLNLNDTAVGIKSIEHTIIERGWQEGWVTPQPPSRKTGKKIAIVGSGPAGLACAQQLARAGHSITVHEKSNRIGGLLRYGIPDFKLEKLHIDRRLAQMEAEGVEFLPSTYVGQASDAEDGLTVITPDELLAHYDAVVLAGGCEQPRDLPVPGRDLDGVHFAMDFLRLQNKTNHGDRIAHPISAKGKHVVVIGGGDTGSDCVGTSNRQGAASVTQFELMFRPPEEEDKLLTWPYWPIRLRTSSSHEEGCQRDWAIGTQAFEGRDGRLEKLIATRLEWVKDKATGQLKMREIKDSRFEIQADLVLLAMGFVAPMRPVLNAFGVDVTQRGNVQANTDDYCSSQAKVFAAGDMRRGQSLVVWAIREGRQCARSVDEYLMGASQLPR